ncbi:hypothetical protein ACOIC8_27730, partial [Klebsiella pneumoniae]|uniref:hypothetical protein n=1 Tax=Klebsiella pneumoniae TaxID=573 RepID=UPI003B5A6545
RCRIAGKYDVLSTESHFFIEDSWHARRSGASGRSVIHIRHNDMTKTGGLYFSFLLPLSFFYLAAQSVRRPGFTQNTLVTVWFETIF